jgi:succinate dehydrogenase hydrophobic anchor subunit
MSPRAAYTIHNMFRSLFLGFALTFVFLAPLAASAQIIPCGTPDNPCSACHAFGLVSNALNYLVGIVTLVIVLVVVWSGIQIVISKGNPHSISHAKEMLLNAIIGFAIILVAWLGVDTVLKVLTNNEETFGRPWNEIDVASCVRPAWVPVDQNPGTGGTGTSTPPIGNTSTSTLAGGVALTGVPIKPGIACNTGGRQCMVNAALAPKLQGLGGSGWYVSEAWPPSGYSPSDPSGIHRAACHGDGSCVDVGLNDRSAANITDFINRASSQGLYAEWEVRSASDRDALVQAGVPRNRILVLGNHITAPHFSVYNCSSGAAAGSLACGRAGGG